MVLLENFLRSGELGSIHPGMTQDQVIGLLGPPQDESVQRHPKILKYGGLELSFVRLPDAAALSLSLIGLYFAPVAEAIPDAAQFTDLKVSATTTIAEFQKFLAAAGLKTSAVAEYEDECRLELPSGASANFDHQLLACTHFHVRAQAPSKKQIAVSIPVETWKKLSMLARESKRSVAKLCADWINERAAEAEKEVANGVVHRG